jgi:hypothetical protein
MKKIRDLFQTESMTDLKKYQLILKQHENTFQDSKILQISMRVIPEGKEMLEDQERDSKISFKISIVVIVYSFHIFTWSRSAIECRTCQKTPKIYK